jgi:hypothetical protein
MRGSRVAVRLLVALLALLMLHSAAQGQMGRPVQLYQMSGTCSTEVRPDVAVIVGGVAAGGVHPVEAVDRLEKQLALVRGSVESNRGQLQLLERVRTLRNSPPRPQDVEPPFQVVQRLRAELPVNAPIDQILQQLIELGLNRVGDDVLNTSGSRRELVVRFVIRDLDAKLAELQQSCATAAWKAWCMSTPDVAGLCAGDKPPFELQVQNFSVQSEEKVLRPDGGVNYWRFNVSRGQRSGERPELLGNISLRLTGNLYGVYRREPTL